MWRFVVAIVGLLALFGAMGTACEYGPDVTWVNQTDESIVIYLSDKLSDDLGTHLPPQSTKSEFLGDGLWKGMVVIRDEEDNVLFRQKLTWDEFKAQGFRFVFTEDMLRPTPSPAATPAG